MISVLVSLLPVFALVGLGYAAWRADVVDDGFLRPADNLTAYVLFPCLALHSLAQSNPVDVPVQNLVGVPILAVVFMAGLAWLLRRRAGGKGPSVAAYLHGSLRGSLYVGAGAVFALYGEEGLPAAMIVAAAFELAANLFGVIALLVYAKSGSKAVALAVPLVIVNPLVCAVALGVALNLTGLSLPSILAPVIEMLGRAAIPVGLIIVGTRFDVAAARKNATPIAIASVLKLLALPLLVMAGLQNLEIEPQTAAIAIAFAAAPASASSYMLMRQTGGDHRLMSGLLAIQTMLAVISLPVWLYLAGAGG
ncbi:MAG: AEC family transporter [Alphaproteobacteria bacterium]